jgi:hypothetical protein
MYRIRTETPPSSFGRLSPSETMLVATAQDLAICALPLLRKGNHVLLSATTSTSPNDCRVSIMAWTRDCVPVELMPAAPGNPSNRLLSAFTGAGRRVLSDLVGRWPDNARPPFVGVFTDGSGVGFSLDHPSPMAPDWIAFHLANHRPTLTLLPFAQTSVWSMLTAPSSSERVH